MPPRSRCGGVLAALPQSFSIVPEIASSGGSPKVSVSVVTYNHERLLGPALDSVLAQAGDVPLEIVVGEDCSTDRTREVLMGYATRYPGVVVPLLHERNVGPGRNLDLVLQRCRGEYVAHLDGDDLMRPTKLAKQVRVLDERPEHALVFHDMRIFDSDTGATLGFMNRTYKKPVSTLGDLVRHGTFVCNSAKMVRRSALPIGDIDPRVPNVVDWLVHLKTARHGTLAYIDEVLGDYRKHGGAYTQVPSRHDPEALRRYIAKREAAYDEQSYILDQAEALGATADDVRFGRDRLHLVQAVEHLEIGYDEGFRARLARSRHGPFTAPRHRLVWSLRGAPGLLRLMLKGLRWRARPSPTAATPAAGNP